MQTSDLPASALAKLAESPERYEAHFILGFRIEQSAKNGICSALSWRELSFVARANSALSIFLAESELIKNSH